MVTVPLVQEFDVADDNSNNVLPTLPVLGPLQPWVNLVHTVGLPWVIIGVSIWYGIPFAKDISQQATELKESSKSTNDRLNTLDDHAKKAMPLLEEATKAIPILNEILNTKKIEIKEHRDDINELKQGLHDGDVDKKIQAAIKVL